MTRTRQQIIDELEQRKQAESNDTRKTCLSSWLVGAKMWLDYNATDFAHALADAYRGNQITPSRAAGPQAEQARQDTLALIGELQRFLTEGDEAGPGEQDTVEAAAEVDEDDEVTGGAVDSTSHYDSAVSEPDQ